MTASSSATLFTCRIEALSSSLAASSSLLTLSRRVERCLLGHVERHDAPAAPVAQRHRVANKESDRLGVGLDNQAVVRGLTGMGLETSPQPAGIREVCRKPQ